MFKYIKTVGAHTAAPEISYFTVDVMGSFKAGSVLFYNDVGLTPYTCHEDHSGAKYFALEDYNYVDGYTGKIKAMVILPGMIFEADYPGSGDVGGSYLLALAEDGNSFDKISTQAGMGATIIQKYTGPDKCWIQFV